MPTATSTPTIMPSITVTPVPPPARYSFTPPAIGKLCPRKIDNGADREFDSHGPYVAAWAELFTKNSRELWVHIFLRARETQSDNSQAQSSWNYPLWTAPIGSTIIQYSPDQPSTTEYVDTNHQLDIPPINGSALVQRFEIMGDTSGDDIGNCTNDDVYIIVTFNQIQVKYSTP
jgi:hypothetical protein